MDPFDLRLWSGFIRAGGRVDVPAIVDQIAIDSRRIDSSHAAFVALKGQSLDGHCFIAHAAELGAKYAIVRKGWIPSKDIKEITLLYVDDPLKALQEIAGIYRQQQSCLVVGITGSYGKTMVKDLLFSMLSKRYATMGSPESFNSQIGVPLSLFAIRKEHEIALIEAAISQHNEMDNLGEMIAADCGILTNIGKKHIVTLGSLKTTAHETTKLFRLSRKKQWVIIPDDPHITDKDFLAEKLHFWNHYNEHQPHASFLSQEPGSRMPYCVQFPDGYRHEGEINSGFHYFLDLINMAVKGAWLLGVPSLAISAVLQRYILEAMRTEIWKSSIGATFVNDVYCSDPQSVDGSLKYLSDAYLPNRKIFIFGGMRIEPHPHLDKDYRCIGKAIHYACVDKLYLYGQHPFESLIDEVEKESPHTEIVCSETYEQALNKVKSGITPEDIILIKGEIKQPLDTIKSVFNDGITSNQCIINLAAIAANLSVVRSKLASKSRIMVMVKASAYGTDEVQMAKFLERCGIDILGVSYVDEGIALKRIGVKQAIFVLNAAIYETVKVVRWDLEIGVSDKAVIEAVAEEASRQHKIVKVHLHVDTGMSRFGCRPEEALEFAQLIVSLPSLQLEGVMTHFAAADDPNEDAFTIAQVERFDAVIADLKRHGISASWNHAANSCGALRFGCPQYNMARIGLAIYGLYPSPATKEVADLRLAISLVSRIVGINVCKKGETVSYGRSYRVQQEEQKIAVLPIGYFDGLHRSYSEKSVVLIRGQKVPMVGKICMDFMMVDVTDIPNVSLGDSVLIFGENEYGHYLSPEELANHGDSIIYELITCLGPRIQRVFVHEEGSSLY